jgi:transposase
MFKIVYPTCCGIDVHKTFVIACIASTNEVGITSYQMKRFSTFTKGLRELSDCLNVNSCKDVCMESTGKYYIPVYNILETTCNCIVAHPKYVKAIRGKKTDRHLPYA